MFEQILFMWFKYYTNHNLFETKLYDTKQFMRMLNDAIKKKINPVSIEKRITKKVIFMIHEHFDFIRE